MCPPSSVPVGVVQCHENANGFPSLWIWHFRSFQESAVSAVRSRLKPYFSNSGQPVCTHAAGLGVEQQFVGSAFWPASRRVASSHWVTLEAAWMKFIVICPLAAQHHTSVC